MMNLLIRYVERSEMKKPDDECLQEQTQNVFNNVTSYIQRKGISAS